MAAVFPVDEAVEDEGSESGVIGSSAWGDRTGSSGADVQREGPDTEENVTSVPGYALNTFGEIGTFSETEPRSRPRVLPAGAGLPKGKPRSMSPSGGAHFSSGLACRAAEMGLGPMVVVGERGGLSRELEEVEKLLTDTFLSPSPVRDSRL